MSETIYEGTYIDMRNGIKSQIRFTYQLKDGKMINEKEIEVKEYKPFG